VIGASSTSIKQQFVQPVSRMSRDAREDISEPGLRIDAIHFRCDDRAVHDRRPPTSAIGAAEQPGFSTESDASQAALSGIVRGLASTFRVFGS
jgi:hypothetical protein